MELTKLEGIKRDIVIFSIGVIISLLCFYIYIDIQFQEEKVIERFEKYLYLEDLPPQIRTRINAGMTIETLQRQYETDIVNYLIKKIIKEEIKLICYGGRNDY